jgi:hypothetical protein
MNLAESSGRLWLKEGCFASSDDDGGGGIARNSPLQFRTSLPLSIDICLH